MSLNAESQHLLPNPPSAQGTEYETFDSHQHHPEGDGTTPASATGEQPQDCNSNETSTSNEPKDIEHAQPRSRRHSRISSCLSSLKPLKYLAIAFGLWSDLGRWSLCLIIPIVISILPLEIQLVTPSYKCNTDVLFSNDSYGHRSETNRNESGEVAIETIAVWIPSYLMMVYCVRRTHPNALRLPQAFKIAKTTKLVNLILFVSLTIIVLSLLTRIYVPNQGSVYVYDEYAPRGHICNYKTSVTNQVGYLTWRLFTSIVTWQAVISCLVFGVVMKALTSLVDECLERIVTTRADSVDDYVQIHQELCLKVESTVAAYKKWFVVNTFMYIVLFFLAIAQTVNSVLNQSGILDLPYETGVLCSFRYGSYGPIFSFMLSHVSSFLVLFLYASFSVYYPWHSIAHLKRSFESFIKKLNSKTDWSPHHPFKNRQLLNTFIQYAKNTKYCSFMKFTCSSNIPYISVLLAICGLYLAFAHL